ncbi:MAG TPA: hypothetical protein VF782_03680 [Allosphingosinicella sp.]|jgi:hypothetical protein
MSRYVLLNPGSEDVAAAIALVGEVAGATILDRTDGRALLLEAEPEALERIRERLPGWQVASETRTAKPRPPFPRPAWKLED